MADDLVVGEIANPSVGEDMPDGPVVNSEIANLPVTDFVYDSDAEISPHNGGTNRIPINAKHIRFLVDQFKRNNTNFVRLARMSKCRVVSEADPKAPRYADFTDYGVLPGQSLMPAQVKLVYRAWLRRKAELDTEPIADNE